jgi:tetratricopeptide (TPR) repeat protein
MTGIAGVKFSAKPSSSSSGSADRLNWNHTTSNAALGLELQADYIEYDSKKKGEILMLGHPKITRKKGLRLYRAHADQSDYDESGEVLRMIGHATFTFSDVPYSIIENTANRIVLTGGPADHGQEADRLRGQQLREKAVEEYQRAIQADPKKIQARLDLGDTLIRLGRKDSAWVIYHQAAEDFPDSAQPLLKMGNYHHELKQADKAREGYRKALEKDPQCIEASNNLAVLDMEEKNYKEAAKLLDVCIKLKPDYANAYMNRGIIARDVEHDSKVALENYRKYVELKGPRTAQARKWIAELEKKQKYDK